MRYFEYARQHQYLCSTTWRFLTCDRPTSSRPGEVNRTKPNQKPIEPNRTQSFDWSSIGSAIEHNRTGTFL